MIATSAQQRAISDVPEEVLKEWRDALEEREGNGGDGSEKVK